MSRHLALRGLGHALLRELDDEWIMTSELVDRLGLDHNRDWLKVALALERLANDGLAELKTPARPSVSSAAEGRRHD